MVKFFIDQHGCAKNRVDGEILATYLGNSKEKYELTMDSAQADLIIINSCGFIKSAKEESLNALMETKAAYPDKKVILAGCLAERYAELFSKSLPEADGIFGNGELSGIEKLADDVMAQKRPVEKMPQKGVSFCMRQVSFGFKNSAFVKITEGCSNHCSFCAIPLIRGELRSRPADSIIEEIKKLVSDGVYEINLIGQDLAAYGTGVDDKEIRSELAKLAGVEITDQANDFFPASGVTPLAALLELVSKIEGDFVVRLLYIHPDHFNFDVLDVMKKDDRFLHYFDIPFQSGSGEIIRLMNRKGNSESYSEMIKRMREILPDMVLRTTFMAGFPGEKDKHFKETASFLETIEPDWSGCFDYSLEDDTPAYNFKHRVPSRKAKKRAEILGDIQTAITEKKLESHLGKTYKVLIEEIIPNEEECLAIGRAWFQAPEVDGAVVVRYEEEDKEKIFEGAVITARILAVSGVDLDSRLVAE
ncbi:MAG: 30S ribosomal protein S12 methylthiotransferase RimO [Treponema sp.]|nr:30S ribosomal protein S12 methylthiotransferase RimO [Treponema sp.]